MLVSWGVDGVVQVLTPQVVKEEIPEELPLLGTSYTWYWETLSRNRYLDAQVKSSNSAVPPEEHYLCLCSLFGEPYINPFPVSSSPTTHSKNSPHYPLLVIRGL